VALHLEAHVLVVEEEDRAVRDPPRALERAHERAHELGLGEHVRELLLQLGGHLLEVEALPEDDLGDPPFDLLAHGVEDEEQHERRDDRVKVEVARVREDQDPEDAREREGEGGEHRQAPRQLVEVEEPVLEDRLRQHEQEHEHEHGADGRDVQTDVRQVLGEREHRGDRARAREEPEPLPVEARARAAADPVDQGERGAEEHRDVEHDHRAEADRGIGRREHGDDHPEREPDRDAVQLHGALGLLRQERAEELHGGQRQRHGEHQVQPLEERAERGLVREEPGQVPGADRRVEEREQPVDPALPRPEQHRRRQREAEDGRDERCL
jgi:hypothetical protein